MFEINEISNFYIEFNSNEEIDLFQKYLDENKTNLRWCNSGGAQIKGMINYKDKYLHINPGYVLTMTNKKYVEPGIKIISFSGFYNHNTQPNNKLLSWIEQED